MLLDISKESIQRLKKKLHALQSRWLISLEKQLLQYFTANIWNQSVTITFLTKNPRIAVTKGTFKRNICAYVFFSLCHPVPQNTKVKSEQYHCCHRHHSWRAAHCYVWIRLKISFTLWVCVCNILIKCSHLAFLCLCCRNKCKYQVRISLWWLIEDIPALSRKWVAFKMADNMLKMKIDPNLIVVGFCCKSLFYW